MSSYKCTVPGCDKVSKKGDKYCSMHRHRLSSTGIFDKITKSPIERILERTLKRDNGCWEWQGEKNRPNGYGRIWISGNRYMVHRIAYEYYRGEIPDGFEVCHKCDNPICSNPEHLFVATHQDNMIDMRDKGRSNPSRGEHSNLSKLTRVQVNDIRSEYENSGISTRCLAKKYSVSQGCIVFIVHYETWKDYP